MSVYRKFDDGPITQMHVHQVTRLKVAPERAYPPRAVITRTEPTNGLDWRFLRKASPANELLQPTLRWAATLPHNVQPRALMQKFARIANLLAGMWRDPTSFHACMDELLSDRRGNRRGFPTDVLHELVALRAYCEHLRASTSSAGNPFTTDCLEFEKIPVADAKLALEGETKSAAAKDWIGRREPEPQQALLDATRAWLAALPESVRPRALVDRFPRIANKLCELWRRPACARAYLEELLLDRRGGRQGFPPTVALELAALKDFHAVLYPYANGDDVWGSGI